MTRARILGSQRGKTTSSSTRPVAVLVLQQQVHPTPGDQAQTANRFVQQAVSIVPHAIGSGHEIRLGRTSKPRSHLPVMLLLQVIASLRTAQLRVLPWQLQQRLSTRLVMAYWDKGVSQGGLPHYTSQVTHLVVPAADDLSAPTAAADGCMTGWGLKPLP